MSQQKPWTLLENLYNDKQVGFKNKYLVVRVADDYRNVSATANLDWPLFPAHSIRD